MSHSKQNTMENKYNCSNVTLNNLEKIFTKHDKSGELIAVNKVSLEFESSKLTTLLGPSGCGKTTILRMIAGFEPVTSGDISVGGKSIVDTAPNKRDLSMVFQSYALFPHMDIYENIAYGLRVKKLPENEIKERTNKVIKLMQLDGMEKRYPNQISGGQQQRIALARAIVIEPKVLLFDEPLSNLDAKLREYMRDEIRKLQLRLGITSIYVTHDQNEAMAISDKVVIMNQGNIEQYGTPQEIYYKPMNKFVANFMGKANFIKGAVQGKENSVVYVKVGDYSVKVNNPGWYDPKHGENVSLVIRPEAVKLSNDSEGLAGTIIRATFLGSIAEYEVDTLGNSVCVQVYNPQLNSVLEVGMDVRLLFDPDCIRILPVKSGEGDEI
ncbi:MAG TPA: ABC transporter ATP-binding protein [Clostridia bacterium]|nr:ABC transporter ATP-binding protein [Clostridia bacterium]